MELETLEAPAIVGDSALVLPADGAGGEEKEPIVRSEQRRPVAWLRGCLLAFLWLAFLCLLAFLLLTARTQRTSPGPPPSRPAIEIGKKVIQQKKAPAPPVPPAPP